MYNKIFKHIKNLNEKEHYDIRLPNIIKEDFYGKLIIKLKSKDEEVFNNYQYDKYFFVDFEIREYVIYRDQLIELYNNSTDEEKRMK
jgi:hypothetical protein